MIIQDCYKDPFYPRFWPEKLNDKVLNIFFDRGNSKGIFVCNMSDLFGIGIPEEWTRKVLETMRACPQHRFYLLTKQPQNLTKFSPFPENCWVGVTATDLTMAYQANVLLRDIEAKVKFMSFEPLLEWKSTNGRFPDKLDWVIIGAQTNPRKLPKIEWVEEIVKACDSARIPVFLKDNLSDLIPVNSALRYGPAGELRLRQEMPVIGGK